MNLKFFIFFVLLACISLTTCNTDPVVTHKDDEQIKIEEKSAHHDEHHKEILKEGHLLDQVHHTQEAVTKLHSEAETGEHVLINLYYDLLGELEGYFKEKDPKKQDEILKRIKEHEHERYEKRKEIAEKVEKLEELALIEKHQIEQQHSLIIEDNAFEDHLRLQIEEHKNIILKLEKQLSERELIRLKHEEELAKFIEQQKLNLEILEKQRKILNEELTKAQVAEKKKSDLHSRLQTEHSEHNKQLEEFLKTHEQLLNQHKLESKDSSFEGHIKNSAADQVRTDANPLSLQHQLTLDVRYDQLTPQEHHIEKHHVYENNPHHHDQKLGHAVGGALHESIEHHLKDTDHHHQTVKSQHNQQALEHQYAVDKQHHQAALEHQKATIEHQHEVEALHHQAAIEKEHHHLQAAKDHQHEVEAQHHQAALEHQKATLEHQHAVEAQHHHQAGLEKEHHHAVEAQHHHQAGLEKEHHHAVEAQHHHTPILENPHHYISEGHHNEDHLHQVKLEHEHKKDHLVHDVFKHDPLKTKLHELDYQKHQISTHYHEAEEKRKLEEIKFQEHLKQLEHDRKIKQEEFEKHLQEYRHRFEQLYPKDASHEHHVDEFINKLHHKPSHEYASQLSHAVQEEYYHKPQLTVNA